MYSPQRHREPEGMRRAVSELQNCLSPRPSVFSCLGDPGPRNASYSAIACGCARSCLQRGVLGYAPSLEPVQYHFHPIRLAAINRLRVITKGHSQPPRFRRRVATPVSLWMRVQPGQRSIGMSRETWCDAAVGHGSSVSVPSFGSERPALAWQGPSPSQQHGIPAARPPRQVVTSTRNPPARHSQLPRAHARP